MGLVNGPINIQFIQYNNIIFHKNGETQTTLFRVFWQDSSAPSSTQLHSFLKAFVFLLTWITRPNLIVIYCLKVRPLGDIILVDPIWSEGDMTLIDLIWRWRHIYWIEPIWRGRHLHCTNLKVTSLLTLSLLT